jgi:hypothetical protein
MEKPCGVESTSSRLLLSDNSSHASDERAVTALVAIRSSGIGERHD